jgi:hypothetical protein
MRAARAVVMSRRRSVMVLAGFAAAAMLLVPWSAAAATSNRAPASPAPTTRAPVPSPVATGAGPCDLPAASTVCNAVGAGLNKIPNPLDIVTGAAESAFTHWLADGAASVLAAVLSAADNSVAPQLGPGSFLAGRMRTMAGLAVAVALLFLLLAVGHALLRGDPMLIVSALLRLPLAFMVTGALLFLTSAAVAVVDQATGYVIGGNIQQSGAQFVSTLAVAFSSPESSGVGLAVVALCALGTILVGLLLYVEFAVRAAVIYLALLFLPIGLAASVWSSAGRVARRLADLLVTAILAKFVIVVTLWLAAGLLAKSTSGGGFSTFVVGLVILLLAAAAPLALLGLVAHAEHAVAGVAGVRRAAHAPPLQAAHAARRAATVAVGGVSTSAAGASALGIVDGRRRGSGSTASAPGGPSGRRVA